MWFQQRDKVSAEAKESLLHAQESLTRVQRRGREVSKVSGQLKDLRERNHFAEQLEAIILRTGGN